MTKITRDDIRNVAIIAHVDHGKTTLVDGMLKQSHIFRENQVIGERILDSNDQERERGITILAKNTAVTYKTTKINIIDTPGHADFGGEVERVLLMADGVLLIVDAVEGPMPQTYFVLKKALELNLQPVVVINKVDRAQARVDEVVNEVSDLFLELATDPEHLEFPVLYASGREEWAARSLDDPREDLAPLFEAILDHVPAPSGDPDAPLQLLVTTLDYDSYRGRYAIGRISRGRLRAGQSVAVLLPGDEVQSAQVNQLYLYQGLTRVEVEEAHAGDIVALTGLDSVSIGDTVADLTQPEALPRIAITEPTVKMTFGVNTSPFSGREGTWSTSRKLRERLFTELETNLSLRVHTTELAEEFEVSGRGELHLAVLIESMRREGYELQVSKPEAIITEIDGVRQEPWERLSVDVAEEHVGAVVEHLGRRQALLAEMSNEGRGETHLEFDVPTRGLLGLRSKLLTETRGTVVINSVFTGYRPLAGPIGNDRAGAMIATDNGVATSYGLANAQERGWMFIQPGTQVYEGMIVGANARGSDLPINVCKEKKLTNIRSSNSDEAIRLTPPLPMGLDAALNFIADDELVEVTPKSIRLRKRLLKDSERSRARKK
ncbi:MAG: translational GTPase TypA [Chloroflexota bacterium]|nr:translational GTPase TypA [Chloroflexota bacterium]